MDVIALGYNAANGTSGIILSGNGAGILTPQPPFVLVGAGPAPTEYPSTMVTGDFNGDGVMDFAIASYQSQGLFILQGIGGGHFAEFAGSPYPIVANGTTLNLASQDINSDGRPDIVFAGVSGANDGATNLFLSSSQTPSLGLTSSANPGITSQPVTFTAFVGGSSCTQPTGSVAFSDNSLQIGTGTITAGKATYTVTAGLAPGIHAIKATYSGDSVFSPGSVQYVEIIGASACSMNVTSQLQVSPGGFVFDRTHQQFVQTVAVKNIGVTAITGPLSLAADGLSGNATLASRSGVMSCAAPSGSPLVDLGVCPGGSLAAGATATVTLRFNDPSMAAISYTPRVLAGLVPR